MYGETQTITKLTPDGQAVMAVDLAKDNSLNPQIAFVCGDRDVFVWLFGSVRSICFYDLESGHILQDARGFTIQTHQPRAVRNGEIGRAHV